MSMKIVFLSGDKQIVLYGQGLKHMWEVESHVLERLGNDKLLNLEQAQFRKFWIDDEGDRVEIINEQDFLFFLKQESGSRKTPKIYFEARFTCSEEQTEIPQSSTDHRETMPVHARVECDGCDSHPIRGFRYKCLVCPNFDLCMKCESEMKHSDHAMIRIPSPNFTPGVFGKRRQRKFACPVAFVAGERAQGDEKSRHHRHHRRHCSTGPGVGGLWANFYDMMQQMAEGGVVPPQNPESDENPENQPQQGPSAAQQDGSATQQEDSATQAKATTTEAGFGAADTPNQSKETNTSPDRSSTSGSSQSPPRAVPVTPSLENLQNYIDPTFMKAGIQILNNFSEMFGKILDPVANGDASRPTSAPSSVFVDLTTGNHASTTPPPTGMETPNRASCSKEASPARSGQVTPMETDILPPSPTGISLEKSPRSGSIHSVENDWTMIEGHAAPSTSVDASAAAAAVVATSPPLDYAMLSQQLQSHIENENKDQSTTTASPVILIPTASAPAIPIPTVPAPAPVAEPTPAPIVEPTPAPIAEPTPAPIPTVTAQPERRAVAVFHPDPKINNAVHAMMAMGFSNEGAMLTQLLESVNGSIPLALDLMTTAQRN